MKIQSNVFETAGECFAIGELRRIEATLEKGADLEMFQIDMLLNLITNNIAPIILAAADPKLLFVYIPLRKIVEDMKKNKQQAQQQHEQNEYAYGFPAVDEEAEEPEAFNFSYY
jgi:hypothetical protein